MQFTKVSLEDIFLELTQNETAPVPDEQDTKPESAPEDENGTDTEKENDTEQELMMKAIYKKEVKSYLTSMIGYVFIFFILLLEGIYFTAYNLQNAYPLFGTTLSAVTFIFLILVPVLTMKTIAEERKQKTDQLLLTAPVSVSEIVLGKFLAVATVYAIPVLIICLYPMIMGKYGTVSYAMAYTAVLGFALLGFAQIAVGVFWSSVTENPVIAAVVTFIVLFVCYMITGIGSLIRTVPWRLWRAICFWCCWLLCGYTI